MDHPSGWQDRVPRRQRLAAIAGVGALHVALLVLLLTSGRAPAPSPTDRPLDVITVDEAPPAPRERAPAKAPKPSAAAPAGKKAEPKEVSAPPARVQLPTQTPAPPLPGSGAASNAGTASAGSGAGAGGSGGGAGGGGGQHARWIGGGISDRDYPEAAKRSGVQGFIAVLFTVRTDGRVDGCRVDRSSGSADLDRLTCALVEQRLRYDPARDAAGRPVEELAGRSFTFVLGRRRPE